MVCWWWNERTRKTAARGKTKHFAGSNRYVARGRNELTPASVDGYIRLDRVSPTGAPPSCPVCGASREGRTWVSIRSELRTDGRGFRLSRSHDIVGPLEPSHIVRVAAVLRLDDLPFVDESLHDVPTGAAGAQERSDGFPAHRMHGGDAAKVV